MKQTSESERQLVILHYKKGKSLSQISDIINRSRSTVQYIIKRYQKENRIRNKARKRSSKKLNPNDERWIIRKIKQNPRLSAPKIASELKIYLQKEVSASTVRRSLRNYGYHGRIARNKPHISDRNRRSRLIFANDYLKQPTEFWNDVIFTDESKFNIFSSDGKHMVWRKPNKEMDVANLRPTVKHGGGSQMVWGCMSAAGVGNLVFVEGNMNKYGYLRILKENLKQSAEKMGIRNTFKLYADNDPKHSSHVARLWTLYNCPKVIQTPSQSPDMNVIEHLWEILDKKIRAHPISNKNDLRKALQEEWNKITPETCKNLVESMPRRLQALKCSKGYPTKY